jgi:hypothetical protein
MLMRQTIYPISAAACMLFAAAHANANLLTNPSFESGAFVNQGNVTMVVPLASTVITGWTVVADQLAWIDAGNPWGLSAEDGTRFLDLTAYPAGPPFGGVTQTIATAPGSAYSLSFFLGSYTARWGGPPVSITATAGGSSHIFTVSTTSTSSTWTQFSMTFTASSASTPITLVGSAGFEYIGLDNVSVDLVGGAATAPEPAAAALVISALALLGLARRLPRNQR